MEKEIVQLNKLELRGWIYAALEGRLDEEGRARLNTALLESAEARAYYFELLEICLTLRQIGQIKAFHDLDVSGAAEPVAPPMPQRPPERRPVETAAPAAMPEPEKAPPARVNRCLAALTGMSLVLTAGVSLYFVHIGGGQVRPAAELAGVSQVRWTGAAAELERGMELLPGPLRLAEGTARLRFAGGTRVIMQAPAEIVLEGSERLLLRRGRLTVFPEDDFVVRTAAASVVDYSRSEGEDFMSTVYGITAGAYGRTEVHVLEGRADLRSGSDPLRFEAHQLLEAGEAAVADEHGRITQASFRGALYPMTLPAEESFGVPGRRVDVAGLATGGSGFGQRQSNAAINPLSGESVTLENTWEVWIGQQGPVEGEMFHPVQTTAFVDGVFVVGRGAGPLTVSSTGVQTNRPVSDGSYGMMIVTDHSWTQKPWKLGGGVYGTERRPGILVHANAGITFDLAALRESLTDVEPAGFHAMCGIPEIEPAASDGKQVDAELRVLVDGREVFRQMIRHRQAGAYEANVKLTPEDRFLTLMCTSGTDGSNVGDWGVFGEPAIELEPSQKASMP